MTPRTSAPSPTTIKVLRAIAAGSRYGFDIMDVTGLPSGTVYPILGRLERNGLVSCSWEETEEWREAGRPARKYYRLTDAGKVAVAQAGLDPVDGSNALPDFTAS